MTEDVETSCLVSLSISFFCFQFWLYCCNTNFFTFSFIFYPKRFHNKCSPWECTWQGWKNIDFLDLAVTTVVNHHALICTDRKSLNIFNVFYLSHFFFIFMAVFWLKFAPPHASKSLLFLTDTSSFSPQTGTRWEVKGVTCRGSSLLPLACQCLIIHACTHTDTLTQFHISHGEGSLSWEPLQVLSKHI